MSALATDEILTPEQTGALLKVNERTLERWRCEGKGPAFVRLGRRVRYRRDDLEAWLVRQRQDR
jgi:excisionase family DNA binding protein